MVVVDGEELALEAWGGSYLMEVVNAFLRKWKGGREGMRAFGADSAGASAKAAVQEA